MNFKHCCLLQECNLRQAKECQGKECIPHQGKECIPHQEKESQGKECNLHEGEVDFPLRIIRGLLKHACQKNSKNHKARVFRAICQVARGSGEFSLAKIREIPEVQKILESARHVEIYALKKNDKVIENICKGLYRLTPLGRRLAEVYCAADQ